MKKSVANGNVSVLGHTYGSTTTSVPCSSWVAEVVDPWELQQQYDIVVAEKHLNRASPKHRAREVEQLARGRRDQPKGLWSEY